MAVINFSITIVNDTFLVLPAVNKCLYVMCIFCLVIQYMLIGVGAGRDGDQSSTSQSGG